MNYQPVIDSSEPLTRRAEWFIATNCVRCESVSLEQHRDAWLEMGISATHIDRVVEFQRRWGGLVLPPSPDYGGGPKVLWAEMPVDALARGGWFDAGEERVSMAYGFMIGPAGEFGIDGARWVPLHASIEGWIESVALAHHASNRAEQITTIRGAAVDRVALHDFEPLTEVRGLADTWWRGPDSLVAIYTGRPNASAHRSSASPAYMPVSTKWD
ncbi:hypothetical protein ACFYV7_06355 [Nocardia suismassiliense]|uniref:Uncharacterized protein n=1 Tax=Nocardia suismassiliense TaxID=2077092 RepID=A0ABW6QMF9_9NOCA